jgi:pimeloyl-ACP methyl ester carboxylesterase
LKKRSCQRWLRQKRRERSDDELSEDSKAAAGTSIRRLPATTIGGSRAIEGYRPALSRRQVKCPVLLLYGADDERVPPGRARRQLRLRSKAAETGKVTMKIFPAADHGFALAGNTGGQGWPRHVARYADTIIDWVRSYLTGTFQSRHDGPLPYFSTLETGSRARAGGK